jgi:hypothetical protein
MRADVPHDGDALRTLGAPSFIERVDERVLAVLLEHDVQRDCRDSWRMDPTIFVA